MADTGIKISALTAASSADDADVLAGVQTGATKKFSFTVLLNYIKSKLLPADIGAVPNTRTVNSKALSADIALTAADVGAATTADIPEAYATNPEMDGAASAGSSPAWARGDHVHPADTSKADVDGVYREMTAGQILSDGKTEEKVPYLFRKSGGALDVGNREFDSIVGGSIVWNQMVDTTDTSVTVPNGHIYAASLSGTFGVGESDGTALTVDGSGGDMVFDLSRLFGPIIADYLYALDQATPGAGVAWFRSLFPKPHYAYNAGALLSVNASAHKTVGFNAYDNTTGTAKLLGGHLYQITGAYTALAYEDLGGNAETITPDADGLFTPVSTGTLTVTGGDGTTTCVHLVKDGSRNGEFSPYVSDTYPLDSDLTLRGVPSLADGKMYYDGDTYEADGTVTRRFGIVDLGTLNWTRATKYANPFFAGVMPSDAALPKPGGRGAVCQKYVRYIYITTSNWYQSIPDKTFIAQPTLVSSGIRVYIRDDSFTDKDTFTTAMSGVYLVYELAESGTETAEPFTSPQAVDNWGTEEYVVPEQSGVAVPVGHDTFYDKDLRGKLEAMPDSVPSTASIAPTENGDTASRAYAQGKYFFRNGDFCKALTAISAGASFTLNTNYAVTTVADELYTALH